MDFGTVHDLDRLPPREGDLSGTPLYLAPEIFAGGAPSISSDVYALAVLCFYLLTGRHPVPGRTLEDVRTGHRLSPPARLRDIRPDVPEALAAAIERGLAADPAKRHANARTFELALEAARVSPTEAAPSPTPRSARLRTRPALIAAAATLVVLSAAYFVWGLASKTAFRARDWVLVTSFDNRTGDDQFTGVLEHALEYELSNSAYVNVVPRERVDDALRLMARPVTTVVSASVGPEIALRDGGIRFVLDGAIEPIGTGYAMTVRVVDPRTGRSMATAREEAPGPAAVPAAVRSLSNWVRGRFGEAPAAIAQDAAGLEKVRTPSLRALRDYSDAVHAFHLADYDEAEKLLRLALAEDPGFASAHARLGWTLLSLKRPRKEYVAEFGRAADLAGSATEREQYAILGALHQWTYETDRAIEQYEALVRRYPDDTSGLSNLQKLYRAAGRRDQVTELMARIADALPHDFVAQTGYAQALVESSGLDAARPQVSRAQSLFSTAPTHFDGAVGPVRSWVLMFPAHELWVQGRAQAASAVLDALWARPELDAEGFVAETILEKLRLALGQLRLATDASARINTQPYKGIVLAELALARDDPKAIVALLGSGQASDFGAVSLLVRAGDLDAAERLLRRLPNTPLHSQWAADEIAEARGENSFLVREALKAGVPWTRVMTGMRAFLYSETLARAAVQIGDVPGAIRVLEDTAPLGEKAYPPNMQSGYYWMRTQALLATLYRQNGQLEQARAIERNLLTALAMADADYPLLVELKKTVGG
jgi:tetratricopeptide (TPR) repeat protein